MYWTEEHDRLMCPEILAVDPCTGTKKGAKSKIIADNLLEILEPVFKVDLRAVCDCYQLKNEQKASGIDIEMSDAETAIEGLIEKWMEMAHTGRGIENMKTGHGKDGAEGYNEKVNWK